MPNTAHCSGGGLSLVMFMAGCRRVLLLVVLAAGVSRGEQGCPVAPESNVPRAHRTWLRHTSGRVGFITCVSNILLHLT